MLCYGDEKIAPEDLVKAIKYKSYGTLSTDWRVRTDPGDNEEIQKGAILDTMPMILWTWCDSMRCDAAMLWIVDSMITRSINIHPILTSTSNCSFIHKQTVLYFGWWVVVPRRKRMEWNAGVLSLLYVAAVSGEASQRKWWINQSMYLPQKKATNGMEWNGRKRHLCRYSMVLRLQYSTIARNQYKDDNLKQARETTF